VLSSLSPVQASSDPPNLVELAEYGSSCTKSGINPLLILSIIVQEHSNGNPYTLNVNGIGSFYPSSKEEALRILYKYNIANTDIGIMQINYLSWGNVYSVMPEDLFDPWLNVCIGSKILEHYINRYGYWGIGRYNAVSRHKQYRYMKRIERIYAELEEFLKVQSN